MQNVVIISGHPNLKNSVGNKTILEEVSKSLPIVKIHRLDSLYPDYKIDVAREQAALLEADVIVWQFPFSWYSVPGLMKLWIDQVLVHGFAHGSTTKLGGKKLILSFTTGAPQDIYSPEGAFCHTVEDYLTQFETTATLCNLKLQKPIYTCGITYVGRDATKAALQETLAKEHAKRLIAAIKEIAA